jgi:hypothetical protein
VRENAATKARRYLTEGRLVITHVSDRRALATCRGDGHVYRLTVNGDEWTCTCTARGRCSHLLALGSVVAVNEPR